LPLGNVILGVLFNVSDYLAKWRAGAFMRAQVGRKAAEVA
jgi:hypothetical protein